MLQSYDERNRDISVWIDGRLVHRDHAGISPFDSSVQNGDAVWEGLRVYDGRIFRLEDHLARLRASARSLAYAGIPSDRDIVEALRATLQANEMRDGVHVRLTLSRGVKITSGLDPRLNHGGCSLFVLAEWKPPVFDKGGIRLMTSSVRRAGADVLDQKIHSCNQITSILAKIEANHAGVDDAILLDGRGFVAETSSTHLFMARHGQLATPRTVACPEGITRRVVMEIARAEDLPFHERDLSLQEFHTADEVFCSGTMGELAPVVAIDGRTIGDGGTGTLTRHLSERFKQCTEQQGFRLL